MTADQPAPRLVLFAPPLDQPGDVPALLAAAVAAADVAAVILAVPALAAPRAQLALVEPAVAAVQAGGAAALLLGGADLVGRAGADGVHVSGPAEAAAAAERFRPERIVGVGGLLSRDDAMAAGEAADYVMFGEPLAGRPPPPLAAVVERVGWWAEVFEPPCVGYTPELGGVALLAEAGADFVALGDAVWRHPAGPAAALAIAAAGLLRSAPA
ncbi:MAG TPA: thiamine phosphate synthase [Hyphomicrobiales bacterium]|nr:thiamine phosphate synthase [Hyphomicrobiales bacterium]